MFLCFGAARTSAQSTDEMSEKHFTVTAVPAENGSYTVSPALPADGRVPAGTTLTVTANPEPGYALDAVYYTVPGGMWGTTSYETFTPEMTLTVDTATSLGATFVDAALVEDLNVTHDVIYAQPGVKPLKYDVYAPHGAAKLPGIVIVHGGGWSSNNEDIMRGLARELAREGRYVVFSIDYRWVNELDGDATPNSMHQLIEDVFGAIAHIQEHAGEYGLDPGRLAVTGDSAGGHLSAAAAVLSPLIGEGGFGKRPGVYQYRPSYVPEGKSVAQLREEIMGAVRAAAPSYGPFDAANFSMFVRQTDTAYRRAISPIAHVPPASERLLPHFIVRGTADPLIRDGAVQPYVTALQEAGQPVEYVQVEGAGHAFFDWKPDAQTRATFAEIGVPQAARMRTFFDGVFYPQ